MIQLLLALVSIACYWLGSCAFAYVLFRMVPDTAERRYDFPDGSLWAFALVWPLAAMICAPMFGMALARRGREQKRLRSDEIRRLETEVFGK